MNVKNKKFFEFEGMQVPYYANDSVTIVTAEGEEIRDIAPNYITHLQKFAETKNMNSLSHALLSMRKQVALLALREITHKFKGFSAPLAVTNVIPYGSCYIDKRNERIVINESQGISKNMDADGDNAQLHLNEKATRAVMGKWPFTSLPLILKLLDKMPKTEFKALTKEDCALLVEENPIKRLGDNVDLKATFYKRHMAVEVGIMTSLWNNLDLWETKDMPYAQKFLHLFNSHKDESGVPQRARDIEDTGMKAVRKDGKQHQRALIYSLHNGKVLDYRHAWAITSCSSIGSMKNYQLDWIDDANLKTIIHNEILPLKLDFRDSNPNPQEEKAPPFVEWKLINRLKSYGLINWFELGHDSPDMPPSVVFFLTTPDGKAVGLTDIKRENRDEGLTYAFLLAPVFDNVTIYDANGNVVESASGKWVHPIEHMQKVFSCFDTTVRADSEGPVRGYFPYSIQDWNNPARKEKQQLLYKAFCDYCGRYGDPAPATTKDGQIDISQMGKSIIKKTVVIDYGSKMTEEEMFAVATRAHKKHPFCMVGSKSTSRRIRKYMLSNSVGGSVLDRAESASPYRGACLRSQLQRSIRKCKMTVAMVQFPTPFGTPFITPSGVEKQLTNSVFLPQCFNTKEAYEDYLSAFNIDSESFPATIVDYVTWSGEQRRCWTTSARKTIRIGKLVDLIGNKFMPLGMDDQAYAISDYVNHNSTEVDLIFPVAELVNKDTHHQMFLKAVEADLHLPDGTILKCMLCEHTFYRTGDASENVPARWRMCSYKGADSLPIVHRINKIEKAPALEPDLSDAIELQEALKAIASKYHLGKQGSSKTPPPPQPIALSEE